jgi:hypothetical protein
MRKTAYLFAVWGILLKYTQDRSRSVPTTQTDAGISVGDLETDAIAKAARHLALKNATLYYGACFTNWFIYGVHKPRMWRDNKVSVWRPIWCGNAEDHQPNPDIASQTDMAPHQLAEYFVTQELQVVKKNPSWVQVINRTQTFVPKSTDHERMLELLSRPISDAEREEARKLYHSNMNEARHSASHSDQEAVVHEQEDAAEVVVGGVGGDDDKEEEAGGEEEQQQETQHQQQQRTPPPPRQQQQRTPPPSPKRKRVDEVVELAKKKPKRGPDYKAEQLEIKAATDRRERYALIQRFCELNPGSTNSWLKQLRSSKPKIDLCVQECFGGELDKFLSAGSTLAFRPYKCICSTLKK